MKKFNKHLIIILCSATTLPFKAMELKRRRPQKKKESPLQVVIRTSYDDDVKASMEYIMKKHQTRDISKERRNAIKRFEQSMHTLTSFDFGIIFYPSYMHHKDYCKAQGVTVREKKRILLSRLLRSRQHFEQASKFISKVHDNKKAQEQLTEIACAINERLQTLTATHKFILPFVWSKETQKTLLLHQAHSYQCLLLPWIKQLRHRQTTSKAKNCCSQMPSALEKFIAKDMELKRRRPQKKKELPLQVVIHTSHDDDVKASMEYIMKKHQTRDISKERRNAIKRFEQSMHTLNIILEDFYKNRRNKERVLQTEDYFFNTLLNMMTIQKTHGALSKRSCLTPLYALFSDKVRDEEKLRKKCAYYDYQLCTTELKIYKKLCSPDLKHVAKECEEYKGRIKTFAQRALDLQTRRELHSQMLSVLERIHS